jgi:putative hydrolase of the HAD superfamily
MKAGTIKAVAFDIDGTLYPNYRFYIRVLPFAVMNFRLMLAFNNARKILHQGGADTGEFYREQAKLAGAYLKKSPQEIQAKIDTFFYAAWQNHFKNIRPFQYVRQTIEKFREKGFKTAVMSDFPIGNKLKFMKLDGLWDVELCTEELGALKPALKPFLSLAEALQSPPENILYVGNSVRYDIAGAQNAGMRTALISRLPFLSGTGRADFTFRDYRQLEQFVLK